MTTSTTWMLLQLLCLFASGVATTRQIMRKEVGAAAFGGFSLGFQAAGLLFTILWTSGYYHG